MLTQLLPRHIAILLLVCVAAYALTAGGHFSSTDEEDLYHNTALLASRYADLANIFSGAPAETPNIQRAPQEIGQSLVSLPWYWAGLAVSHFFEVRWHTYIQRAVMTTFNIFVTLLTTWFIYLWGRELATHRSAIFIAAGYALATVAWPYSQTYYREPLVGLCLLVSLWSATRFRHTTKRAYFLVSAAALLLAVATKVVAVVAVPWWVLCWSKSFGGRRRLIYLTIVPLGAILAFTFNLSAKHETLLHYLVEFQFDLEHNFTAFLRYGLGGLLTSPGKGLLISAPPVLISFIGFVPFAKANRREAVAVGGLFFTFLLVYSTRRGWHGGACWGPRYLLPVLPLLMLPGLSYLESAIGSAGSLSSIQRMACAGALGVVAVGVIIQVAAVSVFPLNYYAVKAREGAISETSLNGGAQYLQDLFFSWPNSPILGHSQLTVQRWLHLLQYGQHERLGVIPADPYELWEYMISLDTLDYWWLHWMMQAPTSVSPNERIGVVLAPPAQDWLAIASQGGIHFNRWQINWRDIEPVPGRYDFAETDEQIALMKRLGVEVSALLTYPPDWAQRPGTLVPANLGDAESYESTEWFRFVHAVAARYPNVQYWEVWNEPDMEIFWGGTAEDYFKLLRSSYRAIKMADPNAQVLMSGLAYWPDPTFFETVLDLIAADPQAAQNNHYFDISAWHWYSRSSDVYTKILWARDIMQQRGMDKPIWINETNVALMPDASQTYAEVQWTASPQEQAAFIVQAYTNAFAAGAEKVFVFRLDDGGMPVHWGLVNNDQIPRSAYVALQAVAEFIGDAEVQERETENGITRTSFVTPDGQTVWVIWNNLPVAQKLAIQTNTPTVRVGYPDRRIQIVKTKHGSLNVTLPPATANRGNHANDYFIGGTPLFLFTPSQ